jgi:hypothetical protein
MGEERRAGELRGSCLLTTAEACGHLFFRRRLCMHVHIGLVFIPIVVTHVHA